MFADQTRALIISYGSQRLPDRYWGKLGRKKAKADAVSAGPGCREDTPDSMLCVSAVGKVLGAHLLGAAVTGARVWGPAILGPPCSI